MICNETFGTFGWETSVYTPCLVEKHRCTSYMVEKHRCTPWFVEKNRCTSYLVEKNHWTCYLVEKHWCTSYLVEKHRCTPCLFEKHRCTPCLVEKHRCTPCLFEKHRCAYYLVEEHRCTPYRKNCQNILLNDYLLYFSHLSKKCRVTAVTLHVARDYCHITCNICSSLSHLSHQRQVCACPYFAVQAELMLLAPRFGERF